MGMRVGCEECSRLWREFAAATTEHIRLENKLQLAALQCDLDGIAILTPQVEAAAEKRQSLREGIRWHEAQHEQATTAGQGWTTAHSDASLTLHLQM